MKSVASFIFLLVIEAVFASPKYTGKHAKQELLPCPPPEPGDSMTISPQILDLPAGGAYITITGVCVTDAIEALCLLTARRGQYTTQVEALISDDKTSVMCHVPSIVGSGQVLVDFVKNVGVGLESTVQMIYSGSIFATAQPAGNVLVVETFPTVEFKWNASFYDQFDPTGEGLDLAFALMVSHEGDPVFIQEGDQQLVGANNGLARITISAATAGVLQDIRYPYYYALRPEHTSRGDYQSSSLIVPTYGKTQTDFQDVCKQWHAKDPGPPSPQERAACPRIIQQANLDTNYGQEQFPAEYIKHAESVFKGHTLFVQRTPTQSGHAQSCSYNSNSRALSPNIPLASSIQYESKDGPGGIVGNFLSDVWPKVVCCLQSKDPASCNLFIQKRPIDDGRSYPAPDPPGGGGGDPHFDTFEEVKYDFQGNGDYWLVYGQGPLNFGAQGRMGPIHDNDRATYFHGLAIRFQFTRITILLTNGTLEMWLNGIYFSPVPESLVLPLDDSTSIAFRRDEINIRTGNGFTFIVKKWATHLDISSRAAAYNKGKGFLGLFGNYDDNKENDLTSRTGAIIQPTAANLLNLSLIHNSFGESWKVRQMESLFDVIEDGNPDFVPLLEYPNLASLPADVRAICGERLACYYEYAATGNIDDARQVADDAIEFDELLEDIAIVVPMCDELTDPENGSVEVDGYSDGSIATYACNEEYELEPWTNTRVCNKVEDSVAKWNGTEPVCQWVCNACPENTFELRLDPSSCENFFVCSYGLRIHLSCPAGMVFNKDELTCDDPENYPCVDPPGCEEKNGTTVSV